MGLTCTQAPATEPLTIERAKAHLRLDIADDDAVVTALILGAREQAEFLTGRALVTQKWRLTLDDFPVDGIDLPRPPLVSVQSIVYRDSAGATQTLANTEYDVVADELIGRIVPAWGKSWPSARRGAAAVTVEFTAGYGAANAVPESIKAWMLLTIGTGYANRESIRAGQFGELPRAAWDALLDSYRIEMVV